LEQKTREIFFYCTPCYEKKFPDMAGWRERCFGDEFGKMDS
jgi:hypothetical protein